MKSFYPRKQQQMNLMCMMIYNKDLSVTNKFLIQYFFTEGKIKNQAYMQISFKQCWQMPIFMWNVQTFRRTKTCPELPLRKSRIFTTSKYFSLTLCHSFVCWKLNILKTDMEFYKDSVNVNLTKVKFLHTDFHFYYFKSF